MNERDAGGSVMDMQDRAGPDAMDAMREVTGRARTQGTPSAQQLAAFLGKQPDLGGRLTQVTLDETPRSSGASSGTVLLDAHIVAANGERTILPLVFRYDLGGTFFFQYDLIAQFQVMCALRPTGFPVPQALWLDAEGEIAGRPGLFMRRVNAPAPGGQPFAQGPLVSAPAPKRHAMILNAVRCFARLHTLQPSSLPVECLTARGQGDTFIARALDWDSKELLHAIPPGFGGDRESDYDAVRGDLLRVRDHLMAEAPRGRIAGMAHFLLTLDPLPGVPTDDEIRAVYASARGGLRDWAFCELWGEWRLGVYQVMAFSRLPPEMRHIEDMYWTNTRNRLSRLLPL